jgi:putative chitinase
MDKAGITANKTRIAYFFANIEHECGGFTIPNLTENINYTHARAAQIWPTRIKSADDARQKFGSSPGWQKKLFDSVYGNRMGNRPNTSDGSLYIGRGGPQWTGRDGYAALQRITGLPAVANPDIVSRPENQARICCAFWSWKNLNAKADLQDFRGCVKLWNGGQIGMADRLAQMKGNDPFIARLENKETIDLLKPKGKPDRSVLPDAISGATANERAVRTSGTAVAGAGTGAEVLKTSTGKPDFVGFPSYVTYTAIGFGIAAIIIAVILISRKRAKVEKTFA